MIRGAYAWLAARFSEPSTFAALAAATAAAAPYAGDWKGGCLVATAFLCCAGVGIPEVESEEDEEHYRFPDTAIER